MAIAEDANEKAIQLFEKLGVCRQLAEAAVSLGWKSPTGIQEQAVPCLLAGDDVNRSHHISFHRPACVKPISTNLLTCGSVRAGKDVIGLAQTGSGKTGAFAMPILQVCCQPMSLCLHPPCQPANASPMTCSGSTVSSGSSKQQVSPLQELLDKPQALFALVLSPTRELAIQIAEQFEALGAGIGVRCAVLVGGIQMMAQAIALGKRPHIVVGTPGRVVDHLSNTKVGGLLLCMHANTPPCCEGASAAPRTGLACCLHDSRQYQETHMPLPQEGSPRREGGAGFLCADPSLIQ